MTDPAVCPRCRSENTAVLTLENHATGTRVVLVCDGCGATFQQWAPKPVAGAR